MCKGTAYVFHDNLFAALTGLAAELGVKNGVVLTDGTVLTGDKAVAWVTGATAGAYGRLYEMEKYIGYDDQGALD